jgi:hypothetical protein
MPCEQIQSVDSTVVTLQEYRLAGRFLRRLPVLAHARYIAKSAAGPLHEERPRSVERWLKAMEKTVSSEHFARAQVEDGPGAKLGIETKVK